MFSPIEYISNTLPIRLFHQMPKLPNITQLRPCPHWNHLLLIFFDTWVIIMLKKSLMSWWQTWISFLTTGFSSIHGSLVFTWLMNACIHQFLNKRQIKLKKNALSIICHIKKKCGWFPMEGRCLLLMPTFKMWELATDTRLLVYYNHP